MIGDLLIAHSEGSELGDLALLIGKCGQNRLASGCTRELRPALIIYLIKLFDFLPSILVNNGETLFHKCIKRAAVFGKNAVEFIGERQLNGFVDVVDRILILAAVVVNCGTGKAQIDLCHNGIIGSRPRDQRLNREGNDRHNIKTLRSVYLDKTHRNRIAEGVQIFGVIHLRGRVRILVNWLKTPFFEPFREALDVIYHNIDRTDRKLHHVSVIVVFGRCFGYMDLGSAPHFNIALPDRALC